MPEADICIIGGGAAGLAAAIAAHRKNPSAKIIIIEKKEKLGKKLLATGNGRCNLTNRFCESAPEVIGFFHELGVFTKEEEQGRVYPYSGQAIDVLTAMHSALTTCRSAAQIQIKTLFEASNVTVKNGFIIQVSQIGSQNSKSQIQASQLLLATGGKAAPQFGSTGDGQRLAKNLGHTITKMIPVLTPVECEGDFKALKGVRVRAAVSLLKKGKVIAKETGEVQFMEYGLSGICVMNLSRYLKLDQSSFSDFTFSIDLMPEIGPEELLKELLLRKTAMNQFPQQNLLVSIVPSPLAHRILQDTDIANITANDNMISQMTEIQLKTIAHIIKNLTIPVKSAKGWQFAQCTSGGVALEEIHMDTMESRLIPGLFFAGEIIDYDGPCGGYNLHNAWLTGIKAGRTMAIKCTEFMK